ncbi:MAG: 3'-5' DNA helicase [Icmadophila ericetorum]|nr:3'-5' DNA helicase [Icmadophila ericetorum]
MADSTISRADANDHLIQSADPKHPANLICTLCRNFYNLGWVTGTGGGTSIRHGPHIYIAPSGVQKELMRPTDMFVLEYASRSYLRKPPVLKPSACTPLFLAAFDRGAGCCIHTHSQWAVLVTLLVERDALESEQEVNDACFEIQQIEQIKGIPKGRGKQGMLGYFDRLSIPIIENTAHEEDLTSSLEVAMEKHPDAYAVLVRRHGIYVWGDDVQKAKTQAERELEPQHVCLIAGLAMFGSDDEFGGLDDEDLLLATTQVESIRQASPTQRATKRQRIDVPRDGLTKDNNSETSVAIGGQKCSTKVYGPKKPASTKFIHIPKHTEFPKDFFTSSILNASRSLPQIDQNSNHDSTRVLDVIESGNEEPFSMNPLPRPRGSINQPIEVSFLQSFQLGQQSDVPQRLRAPLNNLQQTTLFGDKAQMTEPSTQPVRRHNWPLASREEPPTPHKLDEQNLNTWVYPTNLGAIRKYQYTIVSCGLYHNLLVALPTGLGKTFIAATIMLNWFRWTKEAQIVFVAPTKPLVAQQVDACFHIAGIPRSETTMLTGNVIPALRAEEWRTKRVFFMTPQTLDKDLKSGIADPRKIVLLVVDEAHRATGNYAYVEVVRFMRRFNTSFRVLALTATPGSSVEGVQNVIDGLGISRVEIRTEESQDIREYVHPRKIDSMVFEDSDEMTMVMELYSKSLQPVLNKIVGINAYWGKDPLALTPYGCTLAQRDWNQKAGQHAAWPLKNMVNTIFTLLASLSHSLELLKYHGIGPFYHRLKDFRDEGSTGKYRQQIIESESFKKMMGTIQVWINNPAFIGHPKLEYIQSVIMNHFLDAGDGRTAAEGVSPATTRVMVFVHYRDSAEEVARVLKRNEPMIRPHVFVGQAHSKGSAGMDQKTQLDIIQKFKSGVYNTLVATSIGEEGLDIGQVDLIVCYDASASPIRMLQRMGRTGRKRAGNIVVTLMKKKEAENFQSAKDVYEQMQRMISEGTRFTFHDDQSPRIVPKGIQPEPDMREIEIPIENTQADLPEPRKGRKIPKKPPKKFHMPDGVRLGFTKASKLGEDDGDSDCGGTVNKSARKLALLRSPTPEPLPPLESVLLTVAETRQLERTYLDVGGDSPQIVQVPKLDVYPSLQRSLRPKKLVKHGRATKSVVKLLNTMHKMTEETAMLYTRHLRNADMVAGIEQSKKREVFLRKNADGHEKKSKISFRETSDTEYDDVDDTLSRTDEALGELINCNVRDESTPTSSAHSLPPSRILSSKPFYTPQAVREDSLEADEDLPDIDALVNSRSTGFTSASDLLKSKSVRVPAAAQRKGRRTVVDSDSDNS